MIPRIVVAPDKLKGTLTALEAAEALARGVRRGGAEADLLPLADGGEGTLEVLVAAASASPVERRRTTVAGPLGAPVEAEWALFPAEGRAVLECASACGLSLVPESARDPLRASTRGVGELIQAAVQAGAREIWVALGGSASTDGGTGLARALGARFLDEDGRELPEGGGALENLARVDLSALARPAATVVGVADVRSPLLGARGAARAFGPQKGASPEQVERLERGLARLAYASVPHAATLVGAGAAGGLGFGLVAFAGGRLEPGAALVARAAGLDRKLEGAAYAVAAEGRLDATTFQGKTPQHVLGRARALRVPSAIVCGEATPDARRRAYDVGIQRVITLEGLADGDAARARREAAALLERAGEDLARALLAPRN